MISKNFLWSSMLLGMAAAQNKNGQNNNNNAGTATSGNGAQVVLNPAVIQSGSFLDGSNGLGAEATQAKSQTSTENFVNFCQGKTLTNGLQITQGSCNGIGM
jgi:transcription initiation factor TFIID subunit 15